MDGILVIVPCGRRKIWEKLPDHGPAKAADAYTGVPFKLNRAYAEKFGTEWVVLSAKYGFIKPDFLIPGPYEVTFKQKNSHPIGTEILRRQVEELHLNRFSVVVALGGIEYREETKSAFAANPIRIESPFEGLPIGLMMQATKNATRDLNPGFDPRAQT